MSKLKNYYLYFTVFVTGAAVLIIEICGTRILAPFYGSSIFVWSSLITVTLGALALGYWAGGKIVDQRQSFADLWSIILIAALSIPTLLQYKKFILLFADSFGIQYGPLVAALLLFSLPLFLLGMVTPFVIRLTARSVESSGEVAGRIFALATVGSIVAALASGFVLIPLFSISTIFYLTALALGALSIIGTILSGWREVISWRFLVAITVLLIIFALGNKLKQSDVPKISLNKQGAYGAIEILYEKNVLSANYRLVGVPRELDGHICMLIDGTTQGCVNPRERAPSVIHTFIDTIQRTLLSPEAEVLILGAGLGMLHYHGVPDSFTYDIVDINPYTREIYERVGTELRDGRDLLIISDARSYLTHTDKTYDLIWNDLFGNASPDSSLLTKESYELVKERLKSGGVLLTHIRGETKQRDPLISSTVSTLRSVFKNVIYNRGYMSAFDDSIIFIASDAPLSTTILNKAIADALKRKNSAVHEFYEKTLTLIEPELTGVILTDDYNPTEHYWAQLVGKYDSMATFRINFQYLSANDFE